VSGIYRKHAESCKRQGRCKCPDVVRWKQGGLLHKQMFAKFELAREFKGELDSGRTNRRPQSSKTVAEHYSSWLPSYRGRTARWLEESTRRDYQTSFEKHVLPFKIARIRVRDLAPAWSRSELANAILGTGFFVDQQAPVATAKHVIDDGCQLATMNQVEASFAVGIAAPNMERRSVAGQQASATGLTLMQNFSIVDANADERSERSVRIAAGVSFFARGRTRRGANMILRIVDRGLDRAMYDAVAFELDIDHQHPMGLIMHGGAEVDGVMRVAQVWESAWYAKRYDEEILKPALEAVGAPLDADITVYPLEHLITP
jgi:hypothetical protein